MTCWLGLSLAFGRPRPVFLSPVAWFSLRRFSGHRLESLNIWACLFSCRGGLYKIFLL